MNPFEAIGEKSRRQLCFELLAPKSPGDSISYHEIMDLCACDRAAAQAAVRQADVDLGAAGLNRVWVRRNFGWDVVSPDRQVELVRAQREKTERAGARVSERISAAQKRRGEISQDHRAALDHETRTQLARVAIDGRARKANRTLTEISKTLELGP